MNPHQPYRLSAVPQSLHARLEIAGAIRALAAQYEDVLAQRRTEIAAIRRECEALKRSIQEAGREWLALVGAELRSELKKYSPNQPRVPAGNSDGGQWTSGSGDGSANTSTDGSEAKSGSRPAQYAALDSGTRTDATPVAVGVQYAGGPEDDESESRANGRPFEGSLSQEVRANNALLQYRFVLAQIRRFDPNWKPIASLTNPDSVEGDIASLEEWNKETKEYLERLLALAKPRDRNTGEIISSSPVKTGDPLIDSTTEKLNDILDRVVARIGPRSNQTAMEYGRLVHAELKREALAAHLPGINDEDLDRTFGANESASYGEKESVRPDLALRRDGKIIAIYDVKTGAGFTTFQVIKYRLRTRSDSFVPLFELHPHRQTIWKGQV